MTHDSIDAWGTLTLSSGTFPCLRMKEKVDVTTDTYLNGQFVYSSKDSYTTFLWFSKNQAILAVAELINGENETGVTAIDGIEFIVASPTAISTEENQTNTTFQLEQNFPNPFNPETTISFYLPETRHISLEVFNVNGQKIATIASGRYSSGHHEIKFSGDELPSGIYIYRLMTGNQVFERKMLLIK